MEPLTKIELGSCTWLGLFAIVCAIAGEMLTLADIPRGDRTSFVGHKLARRNTQSRFR